MTTMIHGEEWEYQEMGTGPAVVLAQGCQSEQIHWLHHARTLSENGFRVIVVPLGEKSRRQARKLSRLLSYLGIGRAVMVGLTSIAEFLGEMKEAHPERVAATCLISPHDATSKPATQIWAAEKNEPDLVMIGRHEELAAHMIGHQPTAHAQPHAHQAGTGIDSPLAPHNVDEVDKHLLQFLGQLHSARPRHLRWANLL